MNVTKTFAAVRHYLQSDAEHGEGAPPREAGNPLRLLPNALSLARLASIPLVWWYLHHDKPQTSRRAACVYVAGGLTDLIDGPLARRIGAVTRFGRFMDPLADRIYYSSLLVILWSEGVLPFHALPPIVVRDVVLVSGTAVLYRRGVAKVEILRLGRLANALLFLAVLALLLRRKRIGQALYTLGASLYVASGMWYVLRAWNELKAAAVADDAGDAARA